MTYPATGDASADRCRALVATALLTRRPRERGGRGRLTEGYVVGLNGHYGALVAFYEAKLAGAFPAAAPVPLWGHDPTPDDPLPGLFVEDCAPEVLAVVDRAIAAYAEALGRRVECYFAASASGETRGTAYRFAPRDG